MIASNILYVIGVIIYLGLRDGTPVALRLFKKARQLKAKRQAKMEARIYKIIRESQPPK